MKTEKQSDEKCGCPECKEQRIFDESIRDQAYQLGRTSLPLSGTDRSAMCNLLGAMLRRAQDAEECLQAIDEVIAANGKVWNHGPRESTLAIIPTLLADFRARHLHETGWRGAMEAAKRELKPLTPRTKCVDFKPGGTDPLTGRTICKQCGFTERCHLAGPVNPAGEPIDVRIKGGMEANPSLDG